MGPDEYSECGSEPNHLCTGMRIRLILRFQLASDRLTPRRVCSVWRRLLLYRLPLFVCLLRGGILRRRQWRELRAAPLS